MIQFEISIKDGRASNSVRGEMVTGKEAAALFKLAGMSLGCLLKNLPREAAIEAVDALMQGMEDVKKDLETK